MKRISLNSQWDVKAISSDGNELFFDGTEENIKIRWHIISPKGNIEYTS